MIIQPQPKFIKNIFYDCSEIATGNVKN